MKKEFLKSSGITEEQFKEYCEKHELNYKSKEVEKQFIKDVFDKRIILKDGELWSIN